MPTDQDARIVLDHFRAGAGNPQLIPLGSYGGFSGARLWHVRCIAAPCCLRAWPQSGPTPDRLAHIHGLMTTAFRARLPFVPCIYRTDQDTTFLEHAGQLWEVTAWMPGVADFHKDPSPARLAAACTALAQLHDVWSKTSAESTQCPAVGRRLECLRQWQGLVASGWRPSFPAAGIDPVRPWADRAWQPLQRHCERLPRRLTAWLSRSLPVQPCLCDIWHDHVLYDGDHVTGLVDYGSLKMDHVAVDLARLLGSLVGDNETMFATGIAAYRSVRSLDSQVEALVKVLDESGTVLGTANWLRWLYHEGRQYPDREAVARRLGALVQRMEQWK
jgi:homoserine kinase type II